MQKAFIQVVFLLAVVFSNAQEFSDEIELTGTTNNPVGCQIADMDGDGMGDLITISPRDDKFGGRTDK